MELEAAMSDGDSDDAIDWEADASESDDEAPAPRPPDAHPRAPEAPEDAAPPPKRRKVSYREAQAAKQRRESRVLVHKACVVCFLGRLRLLSRWCDDDVATTAAVGAMPPHVARRLANTTDDDGDGFVGGVLGAVEAVRRAVLGRRMEARDARELGSPPGDLAKRVVRNGGASACEAAMLCVAAMRSAGLEARLVGQLDPPPCAARKRSGKSRADCQCFEVRRGDRCLVVDAATGAAARRGDELRRRGSALKPRAFVASCDAAGALRDVGDAFGSKRDGRRKRDAPWLAATLEALNRSRGGGGGAPPAVFRGLPTSRGAFRSDPTFALPSAFFSRERLRPGAAAVATFKGEAVYRRSDVDTLRTARQWKRERRAVRADELARPASTAAPPAAGGDDDDAALEAAMNAACDAAEGVADPRALFAYDQTEPWAPEPVGADGSIPVNDYGNVEIFDDALVPRGGAWVRGRDAAAAAVDAGAAFAPVVVGFERKRGDPKPKPKVDGVLVAEAHGDAVRARADARAADREARGKATRAKKVGARWAAIARTLLSREQLRASYGA